MAKTLHSEPRFVLLGLGKALAKKPLSERISVCHGRIELETVVSHALKGTTWVSFNRASTDMLLEEAIDLQPDLRANLRESHLLTLTPPRLESIRGSWASSIRSPAWSRASAGSPRTNSSP